MITISVDRVDKSVAEIAEELAEFPKNRALETPADAPTPALKPST